eukprot:Skav221787  [mRNA]  locus=scaffold4067:90745:93413:- [translate_table: standard]
MLVLRQDIDAVVSSLSNVQPAVALDASADWADWPSEIRELEGKSLGFKRLGDATSPRGRDRSDVSQAADVACHCATEVNGEFTTQSNADFDASLRRFPRLAEKAGYDEERSS